MDELLQQTNGFNEIINHLAEWLEKAARNELTDPNQGWEPIRRDKASNMVVFSLDDYRSKIQDNSGSSDFILSFFQGGSFFVGKHDTHLSSSADTYTLEQIRSRYREGKYFKEGFLLGIIFWSNHDSIANNYFPDYVSNLKELTSFAADLGCLTLKDKLSELGCLIRNERIDLLPLLIVLSARRPYNLIGTESNLELIPYRVNLRAKQTVMGAVWDESSNVQSIVHRHDTSPELLRRMSGVTNITKKGKIVQLGCGSLGSKIALHLARSGHGPFDLYDDNLFSPHNYARHGLLDIPQHLLGSKAEALSSALLTFKQQALPMSVDVVHHIEKQKKLNNIFGTDASLIIDSTASLSVREALVSIPNEKLTGKLMHTGLYAGGRVGVMSIEGLDRNPRIDDLSVKLFDRCIDDDNLRHEINASKDPFVRQQIGQGCGSETMIMPDTQVSLYAAAMAENARKLLETDNDFSGLWVGLYRNLGVSWEHIVLNQTLFAQPCDGKKWQIRILSPAAQQMDAETAQYAPVETGGVLIGKVFPSRRTVIISRTLPPPPDSKRSKDEFILGVQGLKAAVEKTQKLTGNTLCYVGTWHSHPRGGGPSGRDRVTLKRMVEQRLGFPTINLIWTPEGYLALMDEGLSFRE